MKNTESRVNGLCNFSQKIAYGFLSKTAQLYSEHNDPLASKVVQIATFCFCIHPILKFSSSPLQFGVGVLTNLIFKRLLIKSIDVLDRKRNLGGNERVTCAITALNTLLLVMGRGVFTHPNKANDFAIGFVATHFLKNTIYILWLTQKQMLAKTEFFQS